MLRIADWFRLAISEPTEWQRIGNQTAALIFARSDYDGFRRQFKPIPE